MADNKELMAFVAIVILVLVAVVMRGDGDDKR